MTSSRIYRSLCGYVYGFIRISLLFGVQWVTVPRTRDIYIRCRRVPLAEVYCSVSENFPLVWTNEVEVIPACGAAEVGEFSTFPALRSFGGWWGFERKG